MSFKCQKGVVSGSEGIFTCIASGLSAIKVLSTQESPGAEHVCPFKTVRSKVPRMSMKKFLKRKNKEVFSLYFLVFFLEDKIRYRSAFFVSTQFFCL